VEEVFAAVRGRGFTTEQDLVNAVRLTFLSSQWVWLPELKSANGIADLVAVKTSRDPYPSSLSAVPHRWVYPLKCLPIRLGITAISFAQEFGTSVDYAREILRSCEKAGFCEYDTRARTWTKVIEPRPVAEKIVAVEVKLRDWRRALYQAVRYLDYASESWVVLDQVAMAGALSNAEDFATQGVGLVCMSCEGDIEVVVRASTRGPRMPTRYWQANAEISRRLHASLPQECAMETLHAI
jgi:hypothetical protein